MQTPVTVQLYEGRVLAQGRFDAYKDGEVRLLLYDAPVEAPELAGSLACVTFHTKKRTAVFLTGVRRQEQQNRMRLHRATEGSGTSVLLLDRPAVISYAEARRSVRFPVYDPSWLSATVTMGSEVHFATVIDLGLTGVALAFSPHAKPAVTPGSVVQLEMTREGNTVSLEARLVRRRDNTQAYAFVGLQHERPTEALENLRRICLDLEELGETFRDEAVREKQERSRRRRR